jgi:hypothetical protein
MLDYGLRHRTLFWSDLPKSVCFGFQASCDRRTTASAKVSLKRTLCINISLSPPIIAAATISLLPYCRGGNDVLTPTFKLSGALASISRTSSFLLQDLLKRMCLLQVGHCLLALPPNFDNKGGQYSVVLRISVHVPRLS